MRSVVMAVDPAVRNDRTAIVVGALDGAFTWILHVERLPQGSDNRFAFHRCMELAGEHPELLGRMALVYDCNGIGQGFHEEAQEKAPRGVSLMPVASGSGYHEHFDSEHRIYTVPKRELVYRARAGFERQWLRFALQPPGTEKCRSAETEIRDVLFREVMAFRPHLTAARNEVWEGEGTNDDTVASLALALHGTEHDGWKGIEELRAMAARMGTLPTGYESPFEPRHWHPTETVSEQDDGKVLQFDYAGHKQRAIRFDARTGRPYIVRPDSDDEQEPEDPSRRIA